MASITEFHDPIHLNKMGLLREKLTNFTDLGLSMLSHASMPLKYWDGAFLTAVHIINRLPTPNLNNSTRFFLLFQKPASYLHFRVFGCACFPNLRPYNFQKFQFRSVKCILLGYSASHKGYRCLSLFGRVYVSRDVLFDENSFPFAALYTSSQPTSTVIVPHSPSSIPLISTSPSSSAPLPSTDLIVTPNPSLIVQG